MTSDRPSPAVQDYLKCIYGLSESAQGRGSVSTSGVAEALGVTSASASNMLKRLGALGYVTQAGRGEFALTDGGRVQALRVLRFHRLLETFLVERLGVPLEEAHGEAEVLEHHLSESLGARIAADLGQPGRDPHGDPIPGVDGVVEDVAGVRLADAPAGTRSRVVRVSDRDAALLGFLARAGLVPGAECEVVEHQPFEGPTVVRLSGADVPVPPGAARAVFLDVP